jgi:hypothetical protein
VSAGALVGVVAGCAGFQGLGERMRGMARDGAKMRRCDASNDAFLRRRQCILASFFGIAFVESGHERRVLVLSNSLILLVFPLSGRPAEPHRFGLFRIRKSATFMLAYQTRGPGRAWWQGVRAGGEGVGAA